MRFLRKRITFMRLLGINSFRSATRLSGIFGNFMLHNCSHCTKILTSIDFCSTPSQDLKDACNPLAKWRPVFGRKMVVDATLNYFFLRGTPHFLKDKYIHIFVFITRCGCCNSKLRMTTSLQRKKEKKENLETFTTSLVT